MEIAIKLRKMLDGLTMDEFIQLIKLCDKSFFINIIFQNFHSQLKLATNKDQINNSITINPNIIKLFECSAEIMQLRDDNEDSNSKSEDQSQIDEFPMEIISYISSFMDFKSLLSFEKTNRFIFISTRSPSSLQELNSETFGKCISYCRDNKSIYHYHRFKNLKRIEMEIGDLYTHHYPDFSSHPILIESNISMEDFPFWNTLESLTIFDEEYAHSEQFDNELQYCNLDQIRTFRYQADDYCESYLKLVSNAQFVDFNVNSVDISEIISNKFSVNNLKGLSVSCLEKDVLPFIVTEKLESLHLPMYPGYMEFVSVKLGNLRELCLDEWNAKDMELLMKHSMKKLERICFSNRCDNGYFIIDSIEPFLMQCMNNSSLQYIHADLLHRSTKKAMIMLRNVFNGRQMHEMKLKICVRDGLGEDITPELLSLINVLNETCEHFMLICDLWTEFMICDKMKELVNKIQQTFQVDCISQKYPWKYVVTNRNCNINGYKENWIMNCNRCS